MFALIVVTCEMAFKLQVLVVQLKEKETALWSHGDKWVKEIWQWMGVQVKGQELKSDRMAGSYV